MRGDCDTCKLMRKGDCAGLDCQGYEPVQYIDPEILKAAQEAHDNRMHKENQYGSRNVQQKEERIKTSVQPYEKPLSLVSPQEAYQRFQKLKQWRLLESRKRGIKAFYIFSDRELHSIAAARITCQADLMFIKGIGTVKYDQYGEAIYRILTE